MLTTQKTRLHSRTSHARKFVLHFALPAEKDSSKATWTEVLCKSLSLPETEVIIAQNRKGFTFETFKEGNTSTTTHRWHAVCAVLLWSQGWRLVCNEARTSIFLKYVDLGGCLHIVCVSLRSSLLSLLISIVPYSDHQCFCIGLPCIPFGRESGDLRYVDMALTLEDESTIEFTNINRDELNVLNTYIHSILVIPNMKKDANQVENIKMMDKKETNDSFGKQKRSQRKALQQSRQVTRDELDDHKDSDSDDDDDEGWEGAHRDEESNDDESDEDEEPEKNGDEIKDDASEKRKKIQRERTQRKASQEALEATQSELVHHGESDSEDDEEGWKEGQHDEESDGESDEADK